MVDGWYPAGLEVPRGASAARLAASLEEAGGEAAIVSATVDGALEAAMAAARAGDRILVFGSFYTVAQALQRRI